MLAALAHPGLAPAPARALNMGRDPCHAFNCPHFIDQTQLFCPHHWALVTPAWKRHLAGAWNENPLDTRYRIAAWEVIRHLAIVEGSEQGRTLADQVLARLADDLATQTLGR